MILNSNYFVGDLYLPEATQTVSDNIGFTSSSLYNFIEKYESICLTEVLGSSLYLELKENFKQEQTLGDVIKENSDQKWKTLYNGEIITLSDGSKKQWKGIIYKYDENSDYNYSFIAGYVYFFYERDANVTRSRLGNVKPKGKNSNIISPASKVSNAWNEFVSLVQGVEQSVVYGRSHWGSYKDYSVGSENNSEFNLYSYINYKNSIDKDTYQHFKPKVFNAINEFGI